ncbi:hypothetical protein HDK77DRAFT_28179 [Phyllosticta capitalensis]|uniref:Uncharacterized protein n=1 Tax=Phyllosticta capitalensis TaxID=121624 RepID=A0ABR1Z170_9PEZI
MHVHNCILLCCRCCCKSRRSEELKLYLHVYEGTLAFDGSITSPIHAGQKPSPKQQNASATSLLASTRCRLGLLCAHRHLLTKHLSIVGAESTHPCRRRRPRAGLSGTWMSEIRKNKNAEKRRNTDARHPRRRVGRRGGPGAREDKLFLPFFWVCVLGSVDSLSLFCSSVAFALSSLVCEWIFVLGSWFSGLVVAWRRMAWIR